MVVLVSCDNTGPFRCRSSNTSTFVVLAPPKGEALFAISDLQIDVTFVVKCLSSSVGLHKLSHGRSQS